MRNSVKIFLILLSAVLGGAEIWRRLLMVTTPDIQPVSVAAYGVLYAICLISLIGAGFIQSGWIRWSMAVLLAAGSLIVDGYQWAVSDFMDYDGFVTMVQSTGDLGNAIAQQSDILAFALIKALLVLFGIGLTPGEISKLPIILSKWLSIPILGALTILLFFRGGDGASGLPSSHSGASYALLYGFDYLTTDQGPRETVSFKPSGTAPQGDIVLIVDESIAGAYLDINSKNGVYSGLSKPNSAVPIYNFGLAASVTHCSVGSNVVLRYGGTRDNYRDVINNKPAIWAYAKVAGLGTVYIDAQRTGGSYQNLMNDEERNQIDNWHQFEDVPVLHRDHAVADRLAAYLNDDKRQFILVNKVGAHFPVSDKFPDDYIRYSPILERGKFVNVTDTAGKDHLDGRQSNWVLYRNSYRNTLLWNVGGFFDRLFSKTAIGASTLIYTADHGQTFHERGEEGKATHCTPNPEIEEGLAPLVVIGDQANKQIWASAAKQGKDKLSHYRIYPTLLRLMGYNSKVVSPTYGPDLFAVDPDPFTFNVKFNARLGSEPIWKHIPLDQIARPPVSDYAQKD